MNVECFFDGKSSEEIYKDIEDLAIDDSEEAIECLVSLLLKKDDHTYDKHIIPQLVCRALLTKGKSGVERIRDNLKLIDGTIYANAAIESLWYACDKKYPKVFLDLEVEKYPKLCEIIDIEVQKNAQIAIFDLIIESQSDPEIFDRFINFFYMNKIKALMDKDSYYGFQKRFYSIMSDSTINISSRTINKFIMLIESYENEEKYQLFLENNLAFLDPLASKVIDKHKLGDDHITDYIIETLKGEYIAVEIEKPQNRIFTQKGDFTSEFTHAFGQVLDFIEWIESNIAYARTKLPNITAPKGMLVIGRRIDLSNENIRKLRRFNSNSKSIEVLTYDDLVFRAKTLYSNMKKI